MRTLFGIGLLFVAMSAPALSTCPTMNTNNVFILYSGARSGCTVISELPCSYYEQIEFAVGAFGYNFACQTHTFLWQFGDGTVATTPYANHQYLTTGTYNVSLTITTGQQALTLTQMIRVGFIETYTPFEITPLRAPRAYKFTVAFAVGAGDWIWDFGDGTSERAPELEVTHIYEKGGVYRVQLSSANKPDVYAYTLIVPARRRSTRH